MRKLKNERGVTLIILVITVIVLLILTSVNINNARYQIGLKEINNLYTDIDILSTKVNEYYLKNNSIPIVEENEYFENSNAFRVFLINKNLNIDEINSNDNEEYYVIDLAKLENLTLNYGKDYYKWTSSSVASKNNSDIYIINKTTHQIYYPNGIRHATGYAITNIINKKQVSPVGKNVYSTYSTALEENEKFTVIFGTNDVKQRIISQGNNESKVLIDTKIEVQNLQKLVNVNNIDTLYYKKETLAFQYSFESDESNLDNDKFIKFAINENNNTATLTSTLKVKNNQNNTVYLWIRVEDINGNFNVVGNPIQLNLTI